MLVEKGSEYLNGGLVAFKTNDLADKLVVSDTDELVHSGTAHLFSSHDCTTATRSRHQNNHVDTDATMNKAAREVSAKETSIRV
jgi:hypothetical protein